MPQSIGDQFRGLPMGELIGGPLMAAAEAQVRLANSTAEFIKTVGFVPSDGTDGQVSYNEVRTVAFKFDRPAGEPGSDGTVPTETVELDVPLLSIVKIPGLGIDEVDITFDMELTSSSP